MKRRDFLLGGAALALPVLGVTGWRLWPEQGFINPCLDSLPTRLAQHELVQAAWHGLRPDNVWDSHAHLLGTGDSGNGIRVSADMDSLLHPLQYAQKRFFLNGGCASGDSDGIDQGYLRRMNRLMGDMRNGSKLLLLAFDRYYTEAGAADERHTTLYIPNNYAQQVAQQYPDRYEWAASIHPYRRDCVAALNDAATQGARAIKWLPAAMGIDPASPLCDRFYTALARHDMPLITHAGTERAVHGGNHQEYGNPLKLRRALAHGVRVVAAHCASLGQDRDLDRGTNGPWVDSIDLFARLMDDPRYPGKLFGDISAMTQTNRAHHLKRILERDDWHARLLNGSDYPLPGVMPLFSTRLLVDLQLLDAAAVPILQELRTYNPLLFDFVTKRQLRLGAKQLARSIFETRTFFKPT